MSGFSLNHGDIGGYTATTVPQLPFKIPMLGFTRGQELMLRWIELSAFTAVYRTHEGNQPGRNHQINDHPKTMEQFARFARVYRALAPYRAGLMVESSERGYPVVRHPWLNFPEDNETINLRYQFMLGSEVMVAPVLDPKRDEVQLYLPAGRWVHLWSGQVLSSAGQRYTVVAPIGAPAVFIRESSSLAESLREALLENGDLAIDLPSEIVRQA